MPEKARRLWFIIQPALVRRPVLRIKLQLDAGGWAILTLKDFPNYGVAGKAFGFTFAVRQHGITLLDGLEPVILATNADHNSLRFSAKPTGSPGEYRAEVKLPEPGAWTIEVDSGFIRFLLRNSKANDPKIPQAGYVMLPLKVIRPGAPIITLSEKEHAERLFVAKGCRACHENGIGPTLTGKKLSANYVSRMLKDPAATQNRSSRAGMWQMPNLNLTAEHVAELTAFLTGQ